MLIRSIGSIWTATFKVIGSPRAGLEGRLAWWLGATFR
jgi:hypothetical protein